MRPNQILIESDAHQLSETIQLRGSQTSVSLYFMNDYTFYYCFVIKKVSNFTLVSHEENEILSVFLKS